MNSAFPQHVFEFCRSHELIRPHDRIVVGVSGGPDSTALLHLLHRWSHRLPITLGVAHFDHQLRGAASRQDAAWVAGLATSLGLPFHGGSGDVELYQREHKLSRQVAARTLRLNFFQGVKRQHGYRAIALGHTADDQLELFFLRLFRGAGPEGLKGMAPANAMGIIRPLLGVSKAQVLAWLDSTGLSYRQDASNLSRRYRRNQVRLDLLPQLLAYNPRLGEAITRCQTLLQEEDDYLAQEASRLLSTLASPSDTDRICLPVAGLLALHPALLKRVLRAAATAAGVPLERLTFRHLSAAVHLCRQGAPGGEISLPGGWRLVREGPQITWQPGAPPLPPVSEGVLPEGPAGTAIALNWTFTWTTGPAQDYEPSLPANPCLALMDYDKLAFPLAVRTVRPGDRFQPLGMNGSKKLQDFFVDAKIPRSQRPFIPLLLSRDQIVWVVGQRLSEPVKVRPVTRRVLKLVAAPLPTSPVPRPAP